MAKRLRSKFFLFIVLAAIGAVFFQNCGPAVLSGDTGSASQSSTGSPVTPNEVGPTPTATTPPGRVTSTTSTTTTSTTSTTTTTTTTLQPTTMVMAMTQNSTNLLAGQTLTYSIRFNSPPLPRRHRVYVHFVNPVTNTFDFQDDIDPTPDVTQWTYGQVVTLNRSIQIPAGAPASRYLVSVGLYDPFTSTDPAKWTGWPVVAGTGVTRDAQGRNIIGAFNVIQVVQAESMSINAPEGEVSTAQKCVDGTGDVTLNGACLWGGADVTGVEGNWLSRGVGSFKVSVAGQYNIQVFASARQALNIWPIMELTIDGVFVGKLNVTGTDAANSYTYVTNLTVGTHTIMLNFPNDYYAPAATPPLDRNLFVDKAHIYLK